MPRSVPAPLALAAATYIVFRALVLATNFDAVAIPSFELGAVGNLAKIASEGGGGAPLYQYYDNCGGHIVTGLLAAPLFALFGDSYLSLKLVPLGLGLCTLLLVWSILARHFDRRAAVLAVFLFALGPPTLTKYSMLAKGNHFENLAFQLAAWSSFARAHTGERKGPWILAAAFAAGFSVFFYFGSLVLVLVLALMHVAIRGPRASVSDLRWALPGFALGLAPLGLIALAPTWRLERFVAAKFPLDGELVQRSWSQVSHFFASVLPRAAVFEDLGPIPARVAETAYLAVFALSWLAISILFARGVRRAWRSLSRGESGASAETQRFQDLKLAPLVLHLPVLLLFLSASTFDFDAYQPPVEVGGYRYLVPHFLFASMIIAVACSTLARARGARAWLARALGGAALATSAFTLPIVRLSLADASAATRYDGWSMRAYAHVLMRTPSRDPATHRLAWDAARIARHTEGLSPALRHEAFFGVGHYLAWAEVEPPGHEGGIL